MTSLSLCDGNKGLVLQKAFLSYDVVIYIRGPVAVLKGGVGVRNTGAEEK